MAHGTGRLRDVEKLLGERDALRERVSRERRRDCAGERRAANTAYAQADAARIEVRDLKARFSKSHQTCAV